MTGRRDTSVVWQAYEGVDRSKPCPGCGAAPSSWCTRGDGRVRRVPCPRRPRNPATLPHSRFEEDSDGLPSPPALFEPPLADLAAVDFGEPRHHREEDV